MKNDQEFYTVLRKQHKPREGFGDIVKVGDYDVLRFNPDLVQELGGKDYLNLACFKGDDLLWVAEFPPAKGDLYKGWNVVTGVGLSPCGPDKVRVGTWGGHEYDVDIVTGEYEYVGWTK